jgi:hypothetical protein
MTKLILAASLLALPLAARELKGVTSPDTLSVAGKDLKLNGMGLRTKAIFKVYVGSLYLETPSKDAAAIIASEQVKRIEMKFLRDVGRGKMIDAFQESFGRNPDKAKLEARLKTITDAIPDLKEGDKLTLTYVPGKGTTVTTAEGKDAATVEGKDFGDALIGVWLGKEPVSDDLKDGLLGN